MIIFKTLKWNNFFSYGKDNSIDFTEAPVTQLVGLNGVGKTSIPLILQEIAYGKNVKKIIKANLANRNTSGGIFAELVFTADDIEYIVKMTRTSKLTVELSKDGEDISSHTAPATMKTLEGILNLDFDTFSQLVYQSSKSNLQFLTATDTQRKKFLINLFNLEKYIEIFDKLKEILVEVNKEVSGVQGKYSVYEDWINQHKNDDMIEKELKPSLDIDRTLIDELVSLKNKRNEVQNINKKINSNNQYIEELKNIDHSLLTKTLFNPKGITELSQTLSNIKFQKSEKEKILKNAEGKKPFCPVCKQAIDISDSKKLAENTRSQIKELIEKSNDINAQLKILREQEISDRLIKSVIAEFEKLSNLIDKDLDINVIDIKQLDREIIKLTTDIDSYKKISEDRANENQLIAAFNSEINVKKQQLEEYSSKLLVELNKLEELFDSVSQLEILKDAFSTNGLISYKLEYLVKDLEVVINEYLEELSRGRFQINFILKGDKLNIEVSDSGAIITINELSEGELAKVNVSTLLAIRKLMQNLSNTKLNLLFLDEIMGVLDSYGREDLIKILLNEESLNTFLVTHEYTHPLVPILNIVQDNNISRIEYG